MSKVISDKFRNKWFSENFGGNSVSLLLESTFYDILENSSSDYCGGYFDFIEEDNGVCWLRINNPTKKFHCVGKENFYDGEMSGEALCIASMIIALNALCWKFYKNGNEELSGFFGEKFYDLKHFASTHDEAKEIFAFID